MIPGFFIDLIPLAALWPLVDTAFNKIDYEEYLLGGGVNLAGAYGTSCGDRPGMQEASTSWSPQVLSRPVQEVLYLFQYSHYHR